MKRLQRLKKVIRNTFAFVLFTSFFVVFSVFSVNASSFDSGNFDYTYGSTNPIRANGSYYTEPDLVKRGTSSFYKTVIEINWTKNVTGTFYLLIINLPSGNNNLSIPCNCYGAQLVDCFIVPNTSTSAYMQFTVYGTDYVRIELLTLTTTGINPPGVVGFAEPDSSHTISWYEYGSDSSASNTANIYNYLINTFDGGFQVLLDSNVSVPVSLYSAWFWCSKRDDQFPRYLNGLPYAQYDSSYHNSTYDADYSFRLSGNATYVMVFYTDSALSASNISVYYPANSSGTVTVSLGRINEIAARFYAQEIIFTNNSSGFTTFEPEFSRSFKLFPLYFGSSLSIPDDVLNQIGQDYDNTYTRLLQQIVNGIGNISIQQITENQTNINTYNTSMTSISSVENNYYNYYTGQNDSVQQSNTLDIVLPNVANDPILHQNLNTFSDLFTQIYNIELIRTPLVIILIGTVLVIILG